MSSLSVSIVTFSPSLNLLNTALKSLEKAIRKAKNDKLLEEIHIVIVDNGPGENWHTKLTEMAESLFSHIPTEIISGHGNIGFGAAHNLALVQSRTEFHLIMNPDLILAEDALSIALKFLKNHPETGGLSPYAEDGNGNRQFLCKRFPTVFDLFLRGIMPHKVRKIFKKRLAHYEMQDICTHERVAPRVPIISGCFMFLRRDKLDEAGGFSPKYFLYFEDFDLSLRLAEITSLAYVPDVKIIHYGGEAGKKGLKHIMMFARSGYTFFKEHGWKLL